MKEKTNDSQGSGEMSPNAGIGREPDTQYSGKSLTGDRLSDIFHHQWKLQEIMPRTPSREFYDQEYININILAIMDELAEFMRETRWKNPGDVKYGWKQHQQLNREEAKNELVDLFHFFINLCIGIGMNADELYEKYVKKRKENVRRQVNGY